MIAAIRDADGSFTGVHRTWLTPDGSDKAPVSTPLRAMGHLLGNGVGFGQVDDVMAAGEGIETMLSLHEVAGAMPITACLSANHLAAVVLPTMLRRLYLVRDDDPAGHEAVEALAARAKAAGIEAVPLDARLGDLNDDLRQLGWSELLANIRSQLVPEDVARFMTV